MSKNKGLCSIPGGQKFGRRLRIRVESPPDLMWIKRVFMYKKRSAKKMSKRCVSLSFLLTTIFLFAIIGQNCFLTKADKWQEAKRLQGPHAAPDQTPLNTLPQDHQHVRHEPPARCLLERRRQCLFVRARP